MLEQYPNLLVANLFFASLFLAPAILLCIFKKDKGVITRLLIGVGFSTGVALIVFGIGGFYIYLSFRAESPVFEDRIGRLFGIGFIITFLVTLSGFIGAIGSLVIHRKIENKKEAAEAAAAVAGE